MDKNKIDNHTLFNAISEINDEWIEQAVDYKRTNKIISFPVFKYVSMAAAILICVVSFSVYLRIQPVNEINPELIDMVNQTPEPVMSAKPTETELLEEETNMPSVNTEGPVINDIPNRTYEPVINDRPIRTNEPIVPIRPTKIPVVKTIEPTELPIYITDRPVSSTESSSMPPTKKPVYFTEEPPVVVVTKTPGPTAVVTPVWTRIPTQAPIVKTPSPEPTKNPFTENPDLPTLTPLPSRIPTEPPTPTPTPLPGDPVMTMVPTATPMRAPSRAPSTDSPGYEPTVTPTPEPTCTPSPEPSCTPAPGESEFVDSTGEYNNTLLNINRLNGPIFLSKYLIKEVDE